MTTSQKEFIECRFPDQRPITFKKNVAKKAVIEENKLYEADMKAMGSKIGFITNGDTGAVELLASFDKGSEEYQELHKRLKVFRLLQGVEIDRSKGLDVDPFPKYFVDKKHCRNELDKKVVVTKKPYFQKYIYPTLNADYNKFVENMNKYSLIMHDCYAKDNTNADFMQKMVSFNPVSDNNSVMNKICHYLEKNIKEIKRVYTKQDVGLIQNILIDSSREILYDQEKFVESILRQYKQFRKQQREDKQKPDVDKKSFNKCYAVFCKNIHARLAEVISNPTDLANIVITVCYKGKVQENKDFAWDVCGDELLENVITNRQETMTVPVEDKNGDIEYLGTRYSLKEVEHDNF